MIVYITYFLQNVVFFFPNIIYRINIKTMLDNFYLRLGLILAGVYLVHLFVTQMNNNEPVENDGTMSLSDFDEMEYGINEEQAPSHAVSSPSSCPKIKRVGMPKKVYHSQVQSVDDPSCSHEMLKNNTNVLPYPQISNNYAPQMDVNQQFTNSYTHEQVKLDCFPKDQLTAQDLLPREDGYNTWQEVNPQAQGALTDQNFLEAGHHYGINTVGQSLKNANLQLRSDPVIPQVATGPWQQSSYEPDTNRRFFEIGQC